jgi:hypothetical protein
MKGFDGIENVPVSFIDGRYVQVNGKWRIELDPPLPDDHVPVSDERLREIDALMEEAKADYKKQLQQGKVNPLL